MQLPRGTFLSIKRSTKVGDLLKELQEMKFTGVCTISFASGKGAIVLRNGRRILAEYQNTVGDTAWNDLQKITGQKVDASLSTLNEAQIQLSLEFNKTSLLTKEGPSEKPAPVDSPAPNLQTISPRILNPRQQAPPVPAKSHQKPDVPKTAPLTTQGRAEPLHAPAPPKIISDGHLRIATQIAAVQLKTQALAQKPEVKESIDISSHQESDSSSFEEDIETFETLDVEAIKNKIHGECKTLIKELNLEHLTGDE